MTTTPRRAIDRVDPQVTAIREIEGRLRRLERRVSGPVRVGDWSLTLNGDGDLVIVNRVSKTTTILARA